MTNQTQQEVSLKDLRIFSVVLALGFILIERWFSGGWFGYLGLFFCIFAVVGVLAPKLMKQPYKFWMLTGGVMGFIMIRILLSITYFILITPIALYFKMIGRDKLNLKKKQQDSYWEDYDKHPFTLERYRRLF